MISAQLSALSLNRNRSEEIKSAGHLTIEGVDSFSHPTLEAIPKPILEALELDMNLKRPSPIQALTVPLMMEGRSVIAQAQTGSGKTVAFTIGLLSRVDLAANHVQCLVMAPTRELADQIVTDAVQPLSSRYSPQLKVEKALAGNEIRRGAKCSSHVIVGTTGTIKSWLSKKYFKLDAIKVMVLDEADFMVKDSVVGATFRKEVSDIRKGCPNAQMLLFSATFPPECMDYCNSLCPGATTVAVPKNDLMLKEIFQVRMSVPNGGKLLVLQDLYEILGVQSSIVFLETKKEADEVTRMMNEAGFKVSTLHGGIDGSERDKVMSDFRKQITRFLITTPVLARGVDVPAVSVVVNYTIPRMKAQRNSDATVPDAEQYLHRIGRTGRFGRSGLAITLIENQQDLKDLTAIEDEYSPGKRMTTEWSPDDIAGLKPAASKSDAAITAPKE